MEKIQNSDIKNGILNLCTYSVTKGDTTISETKEWSRSAP